jgi:type IV pilus assembly protein PilM
MASFLEKLSDLKERGFAGLWEKKESVLGIDIGSSSIKVVQLRREKGRAILETYGALALGPYSQMSIGQAITPTRDIVLAALQDLFREANVTAKRTIMSVPSRSSLLVLTELPAFDEHQLGQMIPIEARKYIPVPISEVTLDWWIVPKRNDEAVGEAPSASVPEKVEVLMIAIHNSIIAMYQDIAAKQKLDLKAFEIETFSAIRSTFGVDILTTLVLDIGAGTSKAAIIDRGVVRLSHTINKGSQDITYALAKSLGVSFKEAEEVKRTVGLTERISEELAKNPSIAYAGGLKDIIAPILDYIFYEANNVIINYQNKHKRSVSRVILIGGGASLKGILDAARKNFDAEVVHGDPFKKLEVPAFLESVLRDAGPEFAVSIGLALRELQES